MNADMTLVQTESRPHTQRSIENKQIKRHTNSNYPRNSCDPEFPLPHLQTALFDGKHLRQVACSVAGWMWGNGLWLRGREGDRFFDWLRLRRNVRKQINS
jgi:hypothetical protein